MVEIENVKLHEMTDPHFHCHCHCHCHYRCLTACQTTTRYVVNFLFKLHQQQHHYHYLQHRCSSAWLRRCVPSELAPRVMRCRAAPFFTYSLTHRLMLVVLLFLQITSLVLLSHHAPNYSGLVHFSWTITLPLVALVR